MSSQKHIYIYTVYVQCHHINVIFLGACTENLTSVDVKAFLFLNLDCRLLKAVDSFCSVFVQC